MSAVKGLKPERVFYYFEELSNIPRCSYDEKKVSDYLKSVGESLGLETIQDETLNIIIRKPATKGYENSKGIVIQGHMDMVCEKEEDSKHDFTCDPIELMVDGDFLHANKTTLGADNGIAVAMGLAILEDQSLEHPELELVVTIAEEVEMDGAFGLSEDILRGRRYLNIDSEEEGTLVMGSAGGELVEVKLPLEFEEVEDFVEYEVLVRGLMGGHSGMEIHTERKNSNKILNEVLEEIKKLTDLRIVSVTGGTKDNAIPRQTLAKIAVRKEDICVLEGKTDKIIKDLVEKYNDFEKDIEIKIEEKSPINKVTKEKVTEDYLKLIGEMHTGVFTYIEGNEDVVESSSNLAIINTHDDHIEILNSTRSSSPKVLLDLRKKITDVIDQTDGSYITSNEYPEWEYKPESELRDVALEVYKKIYGEDMHTTVIHAGLECGVINNKYPDMDIISFGPNMYDVHTPKERLSISSTERVFEYTKELLKALK